MGKKDKNVLHCGVCQVEIPDDDWEKHVKSEQHQKTIRGFGGLDALVSREALLADLETNARMGILTAPGIDDATKDGTGKRTKPTVSFKTNKSIYDVSLLLKELGRGKSIERIVKEGRVKPEAITWALAEVAKKHGL